MRQQVTTSSHGARRPGTVRASLVALAASAALVVTGVPQTAASAAVKPPKQLSPIGGAYLGSWVKPRSSETTKLSIQRVESQIGRRFAIDHQYYRWDAAIPTDHESWTVAHGRIPFLNWKFPAPWSSVSDGSQDAWIAARADAFTTFGAPVYLTLHHEPENDVAAYGSRADFVAAFRHVVDIFRERGVTNVGFVWTMMAWSFNGRSGEDVDAWYPGNGYVDFVGADGYNWAPGRMGSAWVSFATVFDDTNAFAVAHGKAWIAAEYGVQEDPALAGHKAGWFRDMLTAVRKWSDLKAVLYFDSTKAYRWDTDSSASSANAYRQMANDRWFTLGARQRPSEPPLSSVVAGAHSLR